MENHKFLGGGNASKISVLITMTMCTCAIAVSDRSRDARADGRGEELIETLGG